MKTFQFVALQLNMESDSFQIGGKMPAALTAIIAVIAYIQNKT
jgi:hypothetical protein